MAKPTIEPKDTLNNEHLATYFRYQKRILTKILDSRDIRMDWSGRQEKYHIWVGHFAIKSDVLKAQLSELMKKINYARGQVLIIRAFGNYSYDAQQLSWERMDAVRLCMNAYFPSVNYIVEYGRSGDREVVEFILKKGKVEGPTKIPPPFPSGLNHYFDFCGGAYFSP